jgi:hypothetical protein
MIAAAAIATGITARATGALPVFGLEAAAVEAAVVASVVAAVVADVAAVVIAAVVSATGYQRRERLLIQQDP